MVNPLLLPEIRAMLAEGDERGLSDVVNELHAASVAEFSEGLSVNEVWQLLAYASIARQAQILAFFPPKKQIELVDGVDHARMSKLLEAMSHDDRADLLKRLPTDTMESLLPLVAKADREDIRRMLSYPQHSAAALMTTDYATLPSQVTASDAIDQLRQQASQREMIYYAYVIDEGRHLLGVVSLRRLILAKPGTVIANLMTRDVLTVRADLGREEAARLLAKFDFLALPVVDDQNRIVGIITHDDILDVLVEEATDDALKMGGVGPMEEDYLSIPFSTVWRKRSLWLSCLFLAELFTFTALASYEDSIASVIALSLFVPLCISTGGNSGSQAATLITRAMALGHITPGQWWKVLKHELVMGTALGITLGMIGFVRASLTPQSVLGDADRWVLALVIGQSVAAICLWGTLIGSMLPLGFQKLGFDPGYASSPFVATFVDVTGIVIYFSVAKAFLL